jgi:hypothetical protein
VEDGCHSEFWLVAIDGEFTEADVIAYWKLWDNRIDDLADSEPGFWLGVTETVYDGEPGMRRDPVGRFFDLYFLRGTLPDWRLLVIDDELTLEFLDVYQPRPDDHSLPHAGLDEVAEFLARNRGRILVPRESPA